MHGRGRGARGFRNARDKRAGGAQLGSGEEQIGIDGEREGDVGHRVGWFDAGRLEHAQIGDERGGEKGKLLRLAGAGLVRDGGVDEDGREVPAARAGFDRELDGVGERRFAWGPARAEPGQGSDGIDVEVRGGGAGLGLERGKRLEKMARASEALDAAGECDGGKVEMHAGERRGHVCRARNLHAALSRPRDLQDDAA